VIPLESGARIYVGTTVAVTSARTVYVDGFQEDF
jgi:hypothetical protein